MDIPFWLLKKIFVIRETTYDYFIDENGHGCGTIEKYRIWFDLNSRGDISVKSIRCCVAN